MVGERVEAQATGCCSSSFEVIGIVQSTRGLIARRQRAAWQREARHDENSLKGVFENSPTVPAG